MPVLRSLFPLLTALSLCTRLSAQVQQRDSTRLEEIVVTATRSPRPLHAIGSSADQLGPKELLRRQVASVREALQLVPGGTLLLTGAPGGVTSLFLRGVSSSQTLFLIDGVRVNDADASYGSLLGGAELSGLERLELVRGPQSTLYGGAAIGGVVALSVERPQGRPSGQLEGAGGSFASWKGALSAAGTSGALGATVALTANGSDNQRHPNDWKQRTQLVRLDYRLDQHWQAGASFRGLQSDYTSPGDIRSSNTTPAGTTSYDTKLATLWVEGAPLARWQTKLLGSGGDQNSETTSQYNGGPVSSFTLENRRWVLDWQNSVQPARDVVLIGGVNREWSKAISDGDGLEQRLTGVYGEAELTPTPALAFTAGVRSDDYNSFGHATTYRLTAAWFIARSGTKLRGSLGTGFMPPSLAARFGSAFQDPNPELRPERSRGWDAGADQTFLAGHGSVAITWFHNSLRDLLGFESAQFPAKGRSVNIDRAHSSGLELSGRLASGPVDARVAYTLLSAHSDSESDPGLTRLIRRPRHTGSADVLVSLATRATLGSGLLAILDREDTDFNDFPFKRVNPGDYLVARLYGSWQLGAHLTLKARVENLFDQRYEPVYGFPALGRSFTASAALGF